MNKLRIAMLRHDLNYADVAKFLDISQEHARRLGSSKNPLSEKILKKILAIEFYYDNPELQEHLRKIFNVTDGV